MRYYRQSARGGGGGGEGRGIVVSMNYRHGGKEGDSRGGRGWGVSRNEVL